MLAFAAIATAADYTLQWDANSEADLAGYRLYYKEDPADPYVNHVELTTIDPGDPNYIDPADPAPQYTFLGLTDGTVYYFVVTAFDTEGFESGNSNEVHASAPQIISAPTVTHTDQTTAIIEWETDKNGTSVVEYGTTPAMGLLYEDSALVNTQCHA
jgi:hypothetical protein